MFTFSVVRTLAFSRFYCGKSRKNISRIFYPMILPLMILPMLPLDRRAVGRIMGGRIMGGGGEAALRGVAFGFGCGSATLRNPRSKFQISLARIKAAADT